MEDWQLLGRAGTGSEELVLVNVDEEVVEAGSPCRAYHRVGILDREIFLDRRMGGTAFPGSCLDSLFGSFPDNCPDSTGIAYLDAEPLAWSVALIEVLIEGFLEIYFEGLDAQAFLECVVVETGVTVLEVEVEEVVFLVEVLLVEEVPIVLFVQVE